MIKRVKNPFDDLADEYDAWFDGKGQLVFETELLALQSVLPYLTEPWLEIGCGSGRFTRALGIDAGIDPSPAMLRLAARRGTNACLGTGEAIPFQSESQGAVFLITVLCFLESPLAVLKEAYRVLKPGGKVVLGVISKDSPWGKHYEQLKKNGHPIYCQANFWSCREVAALTLEAGFSGEMILSTLFQRPDSVVRKENPVWGYYREAGFIIVVACKPI